MTALGFRPETGRLYGRLLPMAGWPLDSVAASLAITVEALHEELAPLAEVEVVRTDGDLLAVLNPADVVSRMLSVAADRARFAHDRLLDISRAIPYVAGTTAHVPAGHIADERPLDGEVFASQDLAETVETLVDNTIGDLLWMRPEIWSQPYEDQMVAVVAKSVAAGRRCRAIYPARALSVAPVELSTRARAGEEIRLLADVPTRLLVIGSTHAMLPEPLGNADTPRVLVRQPAIVDAVTMLFEQYWRLGEPVAGFERGRHATGGQRALLLEQLAAGAQDEQIARRLGISLRTVRRRVAEVMDELDAGSRFQAGVEAVRRGWI